MTSVVPPTHPSSEPSNVAANFADRHLGPRAHDAASMLTSLGLDSFDALLNKAVPDSIRLHEPLNLEPALSETEALGALRELADRNITKQQMIGLGFYDTITPAVIRRNVLESPAWYTAYTPYQPEISQGRLEALLNYQTMVQDLTGLDIANASLLDEASAVTEAVLLMRRASKTAGKVLLDAELYPQTRAVALARLDVMGIEPVIVDFGAGDTPLPEGEYFGLVVQQPGTSGVVRDLKPLLAQARERGILVTMAADLLALTLIESPAEQGADIAVGTAQRFGVPLFFGGPHAAFMAVRKGLERMLPGRLVGVSKDADGAPAYRLALQTREQHIRRDKATSNICTAQALLAITASMYAVYHGPEGLRAIAERVHGLAARFAASVPGVVHANFFDTVLINTDGRAADLVTAACEAGINIRRVDDNQVSIAFDETTTEATLGSLITVFGGTLTSSDTVAPLEPVRTSTYLQHPVFSTHRSETQMLRYLRSLSDKDLALDRTMIPLGSCTMKLNATAEMEAISWPEFAGIHPYAPETQTEGWRELIEGLQRDLEAITGYDKVSIQPNAGSQGELAGLLAIRGYHVSRGDVDRNVCLIPASAHGTNAASAVLADMKVVVTKTAPDGSIDHADLEAKIAAHEGKIAAIMITYPSTHGVYEEDVSEVCAMVHDAGGQVYIDGANMNALVAVAQPGKFGGDVSHLNLHKTFCIPHGGGGPGVGPVCVREHLAPFLPGDPVAGTPQETQAAAAAGIPVTATRYGSAGVLPISWAYIKMMGAQGLLQATSYALLTANYVAAKLDAHFPVLYKGDSGLVAHECIIDLRDLTTASGVTAEDVAKRLIDYGFHAPTLAFPVAGTLMVEPTESEDLAELDRFIAAMIAIRGEIQAVIDGSIAVADSVLRNAPHTAESLIRDEWSASYSREAAGYPIASLRRGKYFAPVRRIDGAFGDRNLICSCPPPEAFEN